MRIEVTETIAVSPPELFALISDFESHLKHWATGVVEVRRSPSDAPSAVHSYVITGRNVGLSTKVRWDYTVTAAESPSRFAGRAEGGPVPFEEEFKLEAVPEGTKVTLTQELRPKGQLKAATPLLKLAWSKMLQRNLGRLKKRAEAMLLRSA